MFIIVSMLIVLSLNENHMINVHKWPAPLNLSVYSINSALTFCIKKSRNNYSAYHSWCYISALCYSVLAVLAVRNVRFIYAEAVFVICTSMNQCFVFQLTVQVRIIAHLLVGLLLGAVYCNAGNDASKILSNISCIFFFALFLFAANAMPCIIASKYNRNSTEVSFHWKRPVFQHKCKQIKNIHAKNTSHWHSLLFLDSACHLVF